MSQTDTIPTPLLSIMIPTRNRMRTAVLTIQSVLSLPDRELEVFVQDCSDTDELRHYLKENIFDSRLRYHYSCPPLSMVENWNQGMPHLRGEYLCIIGDDDGVSTRLMDAVRWAKCESLDAISATNWAEYLWPDYPVAGMAATLNVEDFTGAIEFPNLAEEVERASYGYGQLVMRLPRVYQSIIKRELFSQLYATTGTYFDGMAPDFYIPYAMTAIIKRYCVVNFPLLISGRSLKSNSGRSKDPARSRRDAIKLHTSEFKENSWPDMLPSTCNYYSILTESMIAGLKNTGQEELIRNINLPLLFASSFLDEFPRSFYILPEFNASIHKMRRNLIREWVRFTLYVAARLIQSLVLPAKKLINRLRGRDKKARGLQHIGEAMQALHDIALESGKQFPPGVKQWVPDKQVY